MSGKYRLANVYIIYMYVVYRGQCLSLFIFVSSFLVIWKLLQHSFNVILGALANAVTASCSLEFVNTDAAKK